MILSKGIFSRMDGNVKNKNVFFYSLNKPTISDHVVRLLSVADGQKSEKKFVT
jgi:hypothetical protein